MILGVVIGVDICNTPGEQIDAFIEKLFEYNWVKKVNGPLINGLIAITCNIGGAEDVETATLTMQAFHEVVSNLARKHLAPF